MIERILSSLKLPASCSRFDKTLFKKLFYEHGDLKARDKKLFQDQVDKIVLHYNLSPKSTNIVAFQNEERRYLELPIVSVGLKERKGAARIAEIVQRTLPHPCLLLLNCGDATAIHVAHQRINGSDAAKITLEGTEQTGWLNEDALNDSQSEFLDALDVSRFRFTNFYDFYSDLFQRVQALNAAEISGHFKEETASGVEETASHLYQYRSLEQQLETKRSELNTEPHFNRKTALKLEIQNLKEGMAEIAKQL
jgi:hypothetical protein